MELTAIQLLAIIAAPVLGGLVKGVAGFGFSFVGTSILAAVFDASFAVSAFIIPLILIELELLNELSLEEAKVCAFNMRYYIGTAAIGTVLGVLLLGAVPGPIIKAVLGLSAVFYGVERYSGLPVNTDLFSGGLAERSALGGASGFFFGVTNVGIQFVAYLKSLDLGRRKFLGVLAMTVLGVSSLRLAVSYSVGYFNGVQGIEISSIMGVISLVSVFVATKFGGYVERDRRETVASVLLMVVGAYLVLSQFV